MSLKWISLLLFALLFNEIALAQKGFHLHVGGTGGLTYVAAQNTYDNNFYELDYKNTFGYSAGATAGYGFKRSIASIQAEGGMTAIRQNYTGQFRPGLGFTGKGEHEKKVALNYIHIGVYTRLATAFKDDYVYNTKVQGHLLTGFQMAFLSNANVEYYLDGNLEPYPSKIRPYQDENYPYTPVEDDKDLFSKFAMTYVVQVGVDLFITEKLAISPAIRGHVAMWDINKKEYSNHDQYKASRFFIGGMYVGVAYFFGRGF
jgi:hypothetical protein